jgi:hypothetical protein
MAAVLVATMAFARRLAQSRISRSRTAPRTPSISSPGHSPLGSRHSSGEQKMTVQHVHVAEGGQAIVGNVNAPTEG